MLWLSPERVTLTLGLAAVPLDNVAAIAINRRAHRLAVEHSDLGPHAVFADCPEQRIAITIARSVGADEPAISGAILPGAAASLSFRTAPSAGDAGGRLISASAVILSVEHDLTPKRGVVQTLTLLALSPTGAADPIIETQEEAAK